MGNVDELGKELTTTDASAPKPICIAPIKAEALPACLSKGNNAKATAFGFMKPNPIK